MNPLNFNLSEWAIHNRVLVAFFMIVCVVAGVWSYVQLGRSEDPPFPYKLMVVEAHWPGASIEETSRQVTERLEKKLEEIPQLQFVTSYTTSGRAIIYVVLDDSIPGKNVPDVWYQVRKKINDIRYTFPQGLLGPFFNDELGDTYGIIYAFTGNGFTHRELRDYVEIARTRLLSIEEVVGADVFGAQDERIYIEFSSQKLNDQHVDRSAIIRSLQEQNAVTPAGMLQSETEKTVARVSGHFRSEEDLRRVNFAVGGRLVQMSDIATVTRGYVDPPQPSFRYNGEPAIGLAIAMREGGDIIALGKHVRRAMAELNATMPIGIEQHLVSDQARVVSHAISEFTEALWEAVGIVMVVSLLSLGLRAGTVVSLSIPLVLAVVFVVMDISGIGLQRISLGALIIAMGLLVDDAMITVESMVARLEEGWTKDKAVIYAYDNTHFPMGTGTLVTIAGFIPVGLAQSTAGEYSFSLFAVVAIALIASWFVAAIFAPFIAMYLLKENVGVARGGPGVFGRAFQHVLILAMKAPRMTVFLSIALLVGSIFGLTYVPQQFFPSSDRLELIVDMKLPQNSSIYATETMAGDFDRILRTDPDIDHWSTYVGRGAVHFYLPLLIDLPNDFLAQVVIVTKSLEARERVSKRIEDTLREKFPYVGSRIYPLELGPPVGAPVQYRVSGPDPARVKEISYDVANILASGPGVKSVSFNSGESAKNVMIEVDQDQARALGLSSQTLAEALNMVLTGVNVTQIRDGNYLIDVVARAESDERLSLATVNSLQIVLPGGRIVPLPQIAKITYGQELPLIWRRNRVPTLTVSANIVPTVQAQTVVSALQTKISELKSGLAPRYDIQIGGTVEENQKAQKSVFTVIPIMLLIMLIVLILQLQSFTRLFLVISVAPFGLIGAVAALLLSGKPLGFIALLGVIALVGMIVRNSVVLVVQIEAEIERGVDPWNAVVDATMHRMRPILLTASAAILAMIPIAPAVFWAPMAYVIMGGLAIATILTLIFLPALYVIWFRVKQPVPALTQDPATSATVRCAVVPADGM
jgi:multidrug efflux pump subunit AcrB